MQVTERKEMRVKVKVRERKKGTNVRKVAGWEENKVNPCKIRQEAS